jgi:hypothetical protein
MTLKKDQIEELVRNGYPLDFADVFNKAFENYKKIALYAGLMIFVFMIILLAVLASIGIAFVGVAALSQESLEQLSLNMKELSGTPLIVYSGLSLLFSCIISPLHAGLIKMAYCAERDEEFHVSTVFSYYTSKYLAPIFGATFLILLISNGLSMTLNATGISIVGPILSLAVSFFTILTIPLIIFSDFTAVDAIKCSFLIVAKQPAILFALMTLAVIGSMVGFIGCCIGVFFTVPFIYSMYYIMYREIIGFDYDNEEEKTTS